MAVAGGELDHWPPALPTAVLTSTTAAEMPALRSMAMITATVAAALEIPAYCTVERGVSPNTIAIATNTSNNTSNKSYCSNSNTKTTSSRSRHLLPAMSSNGTRHSSQGSQGVGTEEIAGEGASGTAVTIEIERVTGTERRGMEGRSLPASSPCRTPAVSIGESCCQMASRVHAMRSRRSRPVSVSARVSRPHLQARRNTSSAV